MLWLQSTQMKLFSAAQKEEIYELSMTAEQLCTIAANISARQQTYNVLSNTDVSSEMCAHQ